jgi:hypothetical protein
MISHSLVGTAPAPQFADLQAKLVDYASRIGELRTPSDALDALNSITTKSLPLCVLGAVRFPVNATDRTSMRLGQSVFLHEGSPMGGGKSIPRSRGENSQRTRSWLGRA